MKANSYRALIVGAGNIGAFYDKPSSTEYLTHAHAYCDHPNYELLGFVDLDHSKAGKAAKIWQTNSYSSLEDFFSAYEADIVSVAVASEAQYKVLKKLAGHSIKVVFCEKPFTTNLQEAQEIIKLYEKKNIKLVVNFTRRFISEFSKLRADIRSGKYGRALKANCVYGKGLLNNGSHLINLLIWFWDDLKLSKKELSFSDYGSDHSQAFKLVNGDFEIDIDVIPSNYYTIFELDLFFEQGRICIKNSGSLIEFYVTKESEKYIGYTYLEKSHVLSTDFNEHMYSALSEICSALETDDWSELLPSIDHHRLVKEIR